MGEPQWREAYADALHDLGFRRLASNVRDCGQVVASRDCLECKQKHAANTLRVYCTARGCAHCARHLATERRERLLPALEKVGEYFAARREQLHKHAREQWQKASNREAHYRAQHRESAERWEQFHRSADYRRAKNAAKKLKQWTERRKRWGFQAAQLDPAPIGKRGKPVKAVEWGWRLLTISPPWDPRNSEELTVRGLKRRYEDVLARWRSVREALGPAVSAIVSVELSSGGFVHAHALCFMPSFVNQTWLCNKAGCFVDVRALRPKYKKGRKPLDAFRAALKEGVKYAVKTKSPLAGDWIAGKRRKMVHPELAARWTIAMHKRQLARVYGEVLRDALKATEKPKSEKEPCKERTCFACGSSRLSDESFLPTRSVAAVLGPLWGRSVRWERVIPGRVKAPAQTGAGGV